MTWLWILLWIGLSFIILGAFAWSTVILQRQKSAWKAYADKHNLSFERGRMMDSPLINGKVGDYFLLCFSDMRDPHDVKARRYVSIIELKHAAPKAIESAAGTTDMVAFLEGLPGLLSHKIEQKNWSDRFHFYVADEKILTDFWDERRIKHLIKILSVKNAEVVMRYFEGNIVVRIETPDPVQNIEKIEQVVGYLMKHIDAVLDKKPASEPK